VRGGQEQGREDKDSHESDEDRHGCGAHHDELWSVRGGRSTRVVCVPPRCAGWRYRSKNPIFGLFLEFINFISIKELDFQQPWPNSKKRVSVKAAVVVLLQKRIYSYTCRSISELVLF
jgi:hypothetical protein